MPTRQPKWKCVGHVGDVDPIAYGGGFVYEDETGVYCPEMTYFEPGTDSQWHKMRGNTPLLVFRVLLERDPSKEWWWDKVPEVARFIGMSEEDFRGYALSDSSIARADVYQSLIHYFGAEEFDSYPVRSTEGKAYFRYWREMRQARKVA